MKPLAERFDSWRVGRRFTPQLAEHRVALLGVLLTTLMAAGLEVLRPWPLKWIVDGALVPLDGSPPRFDGVILWSMAAALVIAVAKATLEYFATIRRAEVGHRVTRSLRHRIFAHLAELPLSFHATTKTGDLLVRLMGDVPMLRTMLVDSSLELLARGALVLATLAVMLVVDPMLTLVAFSMIPLLVVVVRMLSGRIRVAVQKQRKKEGALADFLHEAVAGVAVIQSLGRSSDTVRRFARDNRSSARAGLRATRLEARLSVSVEALLGVVMAAVLGFGSWRVVNGVLSPGELLVFLSYVRSLLKPIRAGARHSGRIAKGTACGDRILQVLDHDVPVRDDEGLPDAPLRPRELAFEDVHFRYDDGAEVLSGFDTRFAHGELTGLFGRSGAGKSTAASLALRLAEPQSGRVTLDGLDIRGIRLQSLRDRFGLCLQETLLFGETLRENLLLGDPGASEAELWSACAGAAVDELVRELPEGLDTVLGSAGVGLSGGQRRRVSLARTLLRRSPILIADEPFAGLDRSAITRVQRTLRERATHGLVILICHEPEHLELLDRVVFLEDGRAVAEGTHAELLGSEPAYRACLGRSPSTVAS